MTEKTIQNYNNRASSYEQKWERYLKHSHTAFLDRVETAADDTILDISGGTGLLAHMLIKHNVPFKELIINDPSEQMLAHARRRLSGERRISFCNDRAEQLSFKPRQFSHIFCLNSFHFYTDQQKVLEQCFSMLKPGGRFWLLDWNRTGSFYIVNQLIKWFGSDHIDTRSLTEMERLLRMSNFEPLHVDSWNWCLWKFFFIEAQKSSE